MEHTSSRAFYTSRVDDDGNDIEIEIKQRTARIYDYTPPSVNNNNKPSTARTFEISPTSARSQTAVVSGAAEVSARSVQYVNPAAYIEKNNDDNASQVSGSALSISSVANSDIVPPLDLQSESYPTRREDYTFSYRNNGEPTKLNVNPNLAYENWLSAKRKILSDEAARRKREEEAKLKEKEERKRLAAEKYQKWLEAKQEQKLKQKPKREQQQQQQLQQQQQEMQHSHQRELKPPADERKIQERIEEWERNKRLEEERRREMKRLEKEKRAREEQKRRQLAQEAWEKWIAEAANKPKPVPLNRGLFTLRGTISDIFVNPNEWKSGDGF